MVKKVVLPGEFLSTEEEFEPGKNAFESDGNIYSGSLGSLETDSKAKEISVRPAVERHVVGKGSVLLGRVSLVKENSVMVELCKDPDNKAPIISHGMAMLPVRNVSRDYVEHLRDCFKVGDLVKVKVSKILPNGIDVATNEPDLGVVKAFCSRCRRPLEAFGQGLKCLSCGSTETRKIAGARPGRRGD